MPTCPGDRANPEQPSTSVSLLDDELMSLGEDGARPRGGRAQLQAGWCPQLTCCSQSLVRSACYPSSLSAVERGEWAWTHFSAEEAGAPGNQGACARSNSQRGRLASPEPDKPAAPVSEGRQISLQQLRAGAGCCPGRSSAGSPRSEEGGEPAPWRPEAPGKLDWSTPRSVTQAGPGPALCLHKVGSGLQSLTEPGLPLGKKQKAPSRPNSLGVSSF